MLELHVHGGPAIVSSILAAISSLSTVAAPIRYAEPGEFTKRAFYNDRLDLTQAEALGDSLSAVTEEQRRLSVQGTRSKLSDVYEEWRAMLLHARGELEALIDFSEDQHFDESGGELASNVAKQVRNLMSRIELHTENALRGELLRNGISVSLIGTPNAGKSSILNQLIGRNAAIVSQKAGTTRDIVEVSIDLGGFLCRLSDTAGLRTAGGEGFANFTQSEPLEDVEEEGIRRAHAQAEQSDIVVIVLPISQSSSESGPVVNLDAEVVSSANKLAKAGKHLVIAINKVDLLDTPVTRPKNGAQAKAVLGGTTADVTRDDRVVQAVRQVIPSVHLHQVYLISCTYAQASGQNRPPSPGVVSAHPGSCLTVLEDDPGKFHAFTTGLIQAFRDITVALQPEQTNRQYSTNGTIKEYASPTMTLPDPSVWEDSLGATTRQRQLLEACRNELINFLDLVPGARPPAESRMRVSTPFQLAAPVHSAAPLPRGASGNGLSAAGGNSQHLIESPIPSSRSSHDSPTTLCPHTVDRHSITPINQNASQVSADDETKSNNLMRASPQAYSYSLQDNVSFRRTDLGPVTCTRPVAEAQTSAGPDHYVQAPGVGSGPAYPHGADPARGLLRADPAPPSSPSCINGRTTAYGSESVIPSLTSPSLPKHPDSPLAHGVSPTVSDGQPPPDSARSPDNEEIDIVAAAEHLRAAAAALGKITGRGENVGDVEEVLGVVFEK